MKFYLSSIFNFLIRNKTIKVVGVFSTLSAVLISILTYFYPPNGIESKNINVNNGCIGSNCQNISNIELHKEKNEIMEFDCDKMVGDAKNNDKTINKHYIAFKNIKPESIKVCLKDINIYKITSEGKEDANLVKLYFQLGRAYQSQNQYENAIKTYTEVIRMDGKYDAARANIGFILKCKNNKINEGDFYLKQAQNDEDAKGWLKSCYYNLKKIK